MKPEPTKPYRPIEDGNAAAAWSATVLLVVTALVVIVWMAAA